MRSICTSVVIAAASMLLVVPFATAADLEAEIADMKQRMEAMEDQLQAQNDELTEAQATVKEQTALIENSGLEEREDVSALSKFIEGVDMSAWVAASYNYNFAGSSGAFDPANLNYGYNWSSNTFQLDQAWISIDKAPTEESRGGFHIDLQAGQLTQHSGYDADIQFNPDGTVILDPTTGDPVTTPASLPIAPGVGIYSAYVSYLAPIFNGVQIDAGIMPTIIGWEVEQQNANWNITRGATWGLQPVTNTGALVTVPIGNFTVQLGANNEPIAGAGTDPNGGKGLTSKVSYGAEKWGASLGVNWGSPSDAAEAKSKGIVDVILWADPLDNLSAYINYDYVFVEQYGNLGNVGAHGLAVGARLGIIDSTGIAARVEYIHDQSGEVFRNADTPGDLVTVTGTIDHQLTDGLTLKAEVRWDHDDDSVFPIRETPINGCDATACQNDQVALIAQLMYEF